MKKKKQAKLYEKIKKNKRRKKKEKKTHLKEIVKITEPQLVTDNLEFLKGEFILNKLIKYIFKYIKVTGTRETGVNTSGLI